MKVDRLVIFTHLFRQSLFWHLLKAPTPQHLLYPLFLDWEKKALVQSLKQFIQFLMPAVTFV